MYSKTVDTYNAKVERELDALEALIVGRPGRALPYQRQQQILKAQWHAQQRRQKLNTWRVIDEQEYRGEQARLQRDVEEEERLWQEEQRALKADGAIYALACVYNVIDRYGTRFQPGCFRKARPGAVKYLFEHDEGEYGKVGEIADVLGLFELSRDELPVAVRVRHPEAKGGLLAIRRYHDHTENGRSALLWLRRGFIKGVSVGMGQQRTTTRTERGRQVTDILESELIEISDGRVQGVVPGTMPNIGNKQVSMLGGRYQR